MDGWNRYIDGYCERLEPGLWAEPLNAITNLAFVIAAIIAWRGLTGQKMPLPRVLTTILLLIGIGSFLFHTYARAWAATADVLPIGIFVLVYLYGANRHFIGLSPWPALAATLLFFPYAPLATYVIVTIFPPIGGSAAYGSIAVLIFAYGILLRRRLPEVSRGLLTGAAILAVSITFRAIDEPLCDLNPYGTHMFWHIFNAIMLAWMIRVLRDKLVEDQMSAPNSKYFLRKT